MVSLSFLEISSRLKQVNLPEFDLVIGIGTGGIVPASIVAFYLNCDLKIITLNFRDEKNNPRHKAPVVISKPVDLNLEGKKVLLVDDVSVSGKTLDTAKEHFNGYRITTLTIKGKADYVLFPDVKDCVQWPWKG